MRVGVEPVERPQDVSCGGTSIPWQGQIDPSTWDGSVELALQGGIRTPCREVAIGFSTAWLGVLWKRASHPNLVEVVRTMKAFGVLWMVVFIAISGYTAVVASNHGIGLLQIFFGDMATMGWPGQFNLDFICF